MGPQYLTHDSNTADTNKINPPYKCPNYIQFTIISNSQIVKKTELRKPVIALPVIALPQHRENVALTTKNCVIYFLLKWLEAIN